MLKNVSLMELSYYYAMHHVLKVNWLLFFYSFCNDANYRIGRQTEIDDITQHPFFRGVDWEHIR